MTLKVTGKPVWSAILATAGLLVLLCGCCNRLQYMCCQYGIYLFVCPIRACKSKTNKKFELILTRHAQIQTVSLSPAISTQLLSGYRSLLPSCTDFLEPRKSRLGPPKSTFSAENFICSLSMSISIVFGAIRSSNVSCILKSPKKSVKTPILAFKVIQGHRIRWQSRARGLLPISD